MSPRALAASGGAVLLALALTGCSPLQDALARLSHSAVTGTPIDAYDLDRDAPFAGSPAEDYGEGFETPEAEPVGDFSREQVEEAYARTRELLEAVYLNQDAVFREDNGEFASLLSGRPLDWYMDNLGNTDPELDTRGLTFNLTNGTAEPVGDVVKVDGAMRAEAARDEQGWDYLAVRTEYTIVHPVARPGDAVSVRLVTTHHGEVAFHDIGLDELEAWPLWWRFVGPAHCLDEHTFTPAYPDEFSEGEKPGGLPQDAYDREAVAEDPDGCQPIKDT
ncbi:MULTISPECIES: hypothetical protein [unclassified Nocardiopsis]|uniref:hypothetical protein n=1 Tax=unclassified Nocardiopsis TaxID=2649073 RepID=UPI00135A4CC1|nr:MULTISPECIES: hypothetical protein [unclassified Nocardiopsis]